MGGLLYIFYVQQSPRLGGTYDIYIQIVKSFLKISSLCFFVNYVSVVYLLSLCCVYNLLDYC
jgi:hypothetical protein